MGAAQPKAQPLPSTPRAAADTSPSPSPRPVATAPPPAASPSPGVPFAQSQRAPLVPFHGHLVLGVVTLNEGLVDYCGAQEAPTPNRLCVINSFAQEWARRLDAAGCDVVALGLQESLSPAVAQAVLAELNRRLPVAEQQNQSRRWKILVHNELKGIGKHGSRTLRLAVLVRGDSAVAEQKSGSAVCPMPPGVSSLSLRAQMLAKSKGLVWTRLLAGIQKEGPAQPLSWYSFALTTAHLPFDSKDYQDFYRARRECLLAAAKLEIDQAPDGGQAPDAAFIFGDLNFRSAREGQTTAVRAGFPVFVDGLSRPDVRLLWLNNGEMQGDELDRVLAQEKGTRVAGAKRVFWQERAEASKQGEPPFLPTCRLTVRRPAQCQSSPTTPAAQEPFLMPLQGCFDWQKRAPSWCDRILVWLNTGGVAVRAYQRLDTGSMNLTDHASVIGIYDLTPP